MAEGGEIKVKLVVDDSTAESQGDEAGKKIASGVNNQLDNTEQNTKTTANSMVSILTGKVGSALVSTATSIAKFGVEYNSKMQDYETNFTTMLGDASKATTFVTDLKNMAASTPFGMEDLADASQTLLSFGLDANDVKDDLQMLGDVSLGNKDKFSSLSLAFAQIQSTGKLTGQDLLQLINAGFNPLNEISKKTGKSVSDLKEDMSNGLITADMVTDAFKSATSEGGTFYDGMASASQTLSGQMSTLQDNVSELAGTAMEVLMPVLQQVVGWLSGVVQWISNNKGLAQGIGIAILVVVGVLGTLSTAVSIATGAAALFGTTVSAVALPMLAIVAAIAAVVAAGVLLYQNWNTIATFAQNVWSSIAAGVQQFFNDLYVSFVEGGGGISGVFEAICDTIADLVRGLFDIIQKVFGVDLSGVANVIVSIIQFVRDSVVDIISGIKDVISGIIDFVTGVFTGNWEKAWNGVKEIFSGFWNSAKNLVQDGINLITRAFGSHDWLSIGKNIIQGIINGIGQMASKLWNAAMDAVKSAWNGVCNFLGIHSPSRKFMWVSQMSGEGAIKGIEDQAPDIQQAYLETFSGATDMSIPSAASAMPSFSFSGLNDLNRAGNNSAMSQSIDTQAIAQACKEGTEAANLTAMFDANKVADATTAKTNTNLNIITKRNSRYGQ